MKLKKLILYAFIPFTLGACTNWLDVAPDDQVNEETLFSEADGYRNALNGIYKNMAASQLYGQELSYGTAEVLSHAYSSGYLGYSYSSLYNYKYSDKDAKTIIENIWSKAYTAIANCNNLIANAEEADPAIFSENILEKNLILGEAYALRAFLHFDMLRLFAPSKKMDDQKTYIPYYDKKKSTYEPHLTVDQVLENVKKDLLKAKDLVAAFDTLDDQHKRWLYTASRIEGGSNSQGYLTVPDDLFFAYRGYRMNYYAIVGTLARVYSWAGELDEAYKAAMEIIKATSYFTFGNSSTFSSNRKLYDELVFVLSKKTLVEDFEVYIPSNSSSGSSTAFCLDLYQIGWSRGEQYDVRFKNFLDIKNYQYYSLKYTKQESSSLGEDIIPMIRLSEMYFIASEYLYKNAKPSEALDLLSTVRYNRGFLDNSSFISSIYDESSFEKALVSEVQKDLLGEGQAFYWYKKFNMDISWNTPEYVIPTPDNENIF
ncbi:MULTISPECIES: RagB/SusD family nutrient uptake outer membrane protein [Butyricimonas]|jgi:hypothetical protein|nr:MULTISPECIES: RagB/SusD family nutrient uptake outer membrane protein [Butyricimonas]MBO4958768.1 RagB/SusD family nutrient uptake outer membrane protein [Butyricimonas sp.]MCI7163687.1 RagB/SusD family nutrient uptake outer membrane protein [Butyricimonas virosa]MCI7292375.1 RagB/SusD family nutrient uptake outer membrane protein [Butyricimonas virosa]MDY5013867.1 RagB/SusD family nutrient uptake outer membrane protein [Butyricimonas virosa]MDY5490114.1 RagB/SusD family nutrient uptake out